LTSLERLVEKLRPHTDLEPIGVIDIGSNSVRLVIYEGAVRAPTPLIFSSCRNTRRSASLANP